MNVIKADHGMPGVNENTPIAPSFPPLRIGDPAPEFLARSTEGMVRLSDYRGGWLLFFSHPGDFTPVCTSEFVALARAQDQFLAMGCSLLGHSVDSLFSHLAWIRAIRDHFDVTVTFPIVEDPSLDIARAYGMLPADAHDAASVRAVYVIDTVGVVRAMISYPAAVGRSVDEMLRLVAALQGTADGASLSPEGWEPGQPMLTPPVLTREAVLGSGSAEDSGWFCRPAGGESA